MDYIKFYEEIDAFIDSYKESPLYKKYLDSLYIIKDKYKDDINNYLKAKNEFAEISEYGKYYYNYDRLKENYLKAKSRLFSYDEVKAYFELVKEIEQDYNKILDEIKKEILN